MEIYSNGRKVQKMMDLDYLNPVIRSVSLYERIDRTEECIAYDSRIFYMVSGDVTLTVGGKKLGHLSPGNLVILPAGTPYKLKGQYLRLLVISFDPTSERPEPRTRLKPVPVSDYNPDLLHSTANLAPFNEVITVEDLEPERDTLLSLVNLYTSAEGAYRAIASAEIKKLLLRVIETVDDHALPARMVEELDKYIRENASEDISNTEIAAIFGYHPFYISNVLKNAKGQSLKQYIISYRIKLARKLLSESARSMNEIAEECGFKDPSYFSKSFKAATGMSPKDYRNSAKLEFI